MQLQACPAGSHILPRRRRLVIQARKRTGRQLLQAVPARNRGGHMTTFVLIHGAYQGGWIWQRVASRLRAKGHIVFTPTLDGCAERGHALRPGITTETHGDEIAALLFHNDLRDVVLVGTSMGGMVMARAAERARERVARLVFADALALFDGERVGDSGTPPP